MICILAEKYDAAKSIVYAIGNGAKRVPNAKDGTFSHWEFSLNGEDAVLVHARGHIIELCEPKTYGEPYAKWDLSVFPLLPTPHRRCVSADIKPEVFNEIASYMKKADLIISATDNDREGDIIFKEIYDYLDLNTPYKRAIYDDLNEDAILAAFHNLADGSTRHNIENAGLARECIDYDIGNNLTVVATKTMPLFVDGKQSLVVVGRVKTATLAMVVEREKAIRSYKPTYYYRVRGDFGFNAEIEKDYKDKAAAQAIIDEIGGKSGVVKSFDVKSSKEGAPKLYNTAKIQADANRLYGYSPKQVSTALEKMYSEYKIITYPRTQSCWLSDGTEGKVKSIIKMLMATRYTQYAIDESAFVPFTKKHFDSSKVDSHPAIMPTLKKAEGISLTEVEDNIYDMICRRALALVLPLAIYNVKSAVIVCGGKEFVAKSKSLVSKGWKSLFEKERAETPEGENSTEIPNLSIGQTLNGTYDIRTVTVEPPHRYTLGSLVEAMERAGQHIDNDELAEEMILNHKSLGTGATRDSVIEDLLRLNYISTNGKAVYATNIGEWIIDNLPVRELTDVVFTAEMEHKLFLVQKGELDYAVYCADMQESVKRWHQQFITAECKPYKISSTGGLKCPHCQGNIVTMQGKDGSYWICENWRVNLANVGEKPNRKCSFILPTTYRGAKLSLKDVECLCKDKSTPFHTFQTKEGKEYKACLHVDKTSGNIIISTEIDKVVCPCCGGAVKATSYGFACENHVATGEVNEKGYKVYKCPFCISSNPFGAEITLSDVKRICKGGVSATKKFSKDDKEFYGSVGWDNENKKICFAYVVNDATCPICGGEIRTSEKNWHCLNNEVAITDESGNKVLDEKGYPVKKCSFVVFKEFSGAKLNEGDLKNICGNKPTRKISFKSKEGKPFDAALKFNPDTQRIEFEFDAIKNICPICKKGEIRHSKNEGKGWYCSRFKEGCKFRFPDIWGGTKFTDGDISSLSKTGLSKPHTMTSKKNGKEFTARFRFNAVDGKIEMVFSKGKKT